MKFTDQESFISTGRDARIVIPKSYNWKPKEDITAYELAKCMPYLAHGNPYGSLEREDITVLRHWEEV